MSYVLDIPVPTEVDVTFPVTSVGPPNPSLNTVSISVTSLGDDLVTVRLYVPVSVVSLRGDPVTDHLNTLIPMESLRSRQSDRRMSRSDLLYVRALCLDTLDDPPSSGRFGVPVPTTSGTPAWGWSIRVLHSVPQCL